MRCALFLIALAGYAAAAPVPKALKAKRPDAEVFVGTWDVESHGSSGKHTWTFDDDLTMWSKSSAENGRGSKWVIKIDPDQSPKHIDIGPGYKGIYEIDGDEIRLVYANGQRTADFDNKAQNNYTVLRRAQK